MSLAARRHAVPFFLWIGALLVVQQLHLTNVIEVAALNQRLKNAGFNAAREFDEALKSALERKP